MSALAADGLRLALGGASILNGIGVTFAPGEVAAIVGANGVGKSTLLTCLAGLRTPDEGRVLLDGSPLQAIPPRLRAQHIGFLAQTPEIAWDVDVRTFVGLGRTPHLGAWGPGEADRAAVERAIAATALEPFAARTITTLSGGERARALIARALAGEPEWLLADEPLAGLDPGHVLEAVALFRALADRGRGVVLTLHDLAVAGRAADRVVVMAEGRILADGPPREALTAEVLAAAYGVEARVTQGAAGPLVEIVGRAAR